MKNQRTRQRTHWYTPFLLLSLWAILGYVIAISLYQKMASAYDANDEKTYSIFESLWVLTIALTIAVGIIPFVEGIKTSYRAFRIWRNRHGHYSPAEQRALELANAYASGSEYARYFKGSLLSNQVPPEIRVWDIHPNRDEVFFVDDTANYSRHYGKDLEFNQTTLAFGSAPVFAAGLVVSGIANANARSQARKNAAEQWREYQAVRYLISNQRIVCHVANRGWLSFWYSAVTGIYPDVEKHELVLSFNENVYPLKLQGPYVDVASTLVVAHAHGVSSLRSHPQIGSI